MKKLDKLALPAKMYYSTHGMVHLTVNIGVDSRNGNTALFINPTNVKYTRLIKIVQWKLYTVTTKKKI